MLNGHSSSTSHEDQLQQFKKNDEARDTLIRDIIRNYEELQLKHREKCDDYSNEVESRRMWQGKAKDHEQALNQQKQASVCRPPFVTWRLPICGTAYHFRLVLQSQC